MKDKAKPYWEDDCPICGELALTACRCPLNDRKCPNGHWWRVLHDETKVQLTGGHGQIIKRFGVAANDDTEEGETQE